MVCIRLLNHILCFTKDVTVEEAIMGFIFDGSAYMHDDNAVIDTKTIVNNVLMEFNQFSRADVVRGIIQLVYEGRLYEVYPNEYKVNEDWTPEEEDKKG